MRLNDSYNIASQAVQCSVIKLWCERQRCICPGSCAGVSCWALRSQNDTNSSKSLPNQPMSAAFRFTSKYAGSPRALSLARNSPASGCVRRSCCPVVSRSESRRSSALYAVPLVGVDVEFSCLNIFNAVSFIQIHLSCIGLLSSFPYTSEKPSVFAYRWLSFWLDRPSAVAKGLSLKAASSVSNLSFGCYHAACSRCTSSLNSCTSSPSAITNCIVT